MQDLRLLPGDTFTVTPGPSGTLTITGKRPSSVARVHVPSPMTMTDEASFAAMTEVVEAAAAKRRRDPRLRAAVAAYQALARSDWRVRS